jgi:ribosome-binding factor A
MSRRSDRLSQIIQNEISDLLQKNINDPRLSGLISVTDVRVTDDMRNAKIYISALANEIDKIEIMKGFNSATGFFRRELAHRLNLRITPELSFHFDDSIEHGIALTNLIDSVLSSEKKEPDGTKRRIKRK